MTETFDDAWCDRIMGDVEATAPEELRAAIGEMVSRDRRPMPSITPDPPRPRRLVVSVAATIVVIVAGLALLGGLGERPTTVPTNSVGPPRDSAVDQRGIAPVTIPTVDTQVPAGPGDDVLAEMGLTGPTTLSGDDAQAALEVLNDHRVELLRNSPGFSARSTFGQTWVLTDGSKPYADNPATVVDVTVLASGDAWAEFENGDVFRHEGAAGVTRGLYTVDGSPAAWETNTFPNGHAFDRAVGHDPLALIGSFEGVVQPWEDGRIEVSASRYERREAVDVRIDSRATGSARYVIDLASGLIVEFESTQVDEKGTLGAYSSLSGVTEAEALPVAALPPLPDGVEWQRFDDSSAPTAVAIDRASEAFGAGLVLPRAALAAGRVAVEHRALTIDGRGVELDDPEAASRYVSIGYVEPMGLLRTIVHLHTERPVPGRPIPPEYAYVDDRICHETTTCISTAAGTATMTPQAGALAGIPFEGNATNFDGIFLAISAPTLDDVVTIADTFVTVDGG